MMSQRLRLHYEEEVPCVYTVCEGTFNSTHLRHAYEETIQLLIKYQATKLLSDLRYLKPILYEDQRWIAHDWLFRATGAGLQVVAVVAPIDSIAFLIVGQLAKIAKDSGVIIQYFPDVPAARLWLQLYAPREQHK